MNIGDIFLDFKVIEKKPSQRIFKYREIIKSFLYTIECIHCKFTKKGHSTIFLKTLKCRHCFIFRNSEIDHIKKDNWIIYLKPERSERARVWGMSPRFKWLCTLCDHISMKSSCNPKISTMIKCFYCNRKESNCKFANERIKNDQRRLRGEELEEEKLPHEIMNYEELLEKSNMLCAELENISIDSQIIDLKVNSRMRNCLYNHGIININQMMNMDKIDFFRIKNMGRKTAQAALILQRYFIIKFKGQR